MCGQSGWKEVHHWLLCKDAQLYHKPIRQSIFEQIDKVDNNEKDTFTERVKSLKVEASVEKPLKLHL